MKKALFLILLSFTTSYVSAYQPILRKTLVCNTGPVFCVTFSHDGKILASASPNIAELWDLNTYNKIGSYNHDSQVVSVRFSPDDSQLALSTAFQMSKGIILWEFKTGKTEILHTNNHAPFMEFTSDNTSIYWMDDQIPDPESRDGSFIKADRTYLKKWDFATNDNSILFPMCIVTDRLYPIGVKKTSEGKKNVWGISDRKILSVAFSRDTKIIAVKDDRGIIEIWDILNSKLINTCNDVMSPNNSLSFSPDGKMLASGSGDKTVVLWNVVTGEKNMTLQGIQNNKEIPCVTYSPDGKLLATYGFDKKINLWRISEEKIIANVETSSESIKCVNFSPDGKKIAAACYEGNVEIWDISSLNEKEK